MVMTVEEARSAGRARGKLVGEAVSDLRYIEGCIYSSEEEAFFQRLKVGLCIMLGGHHSPWGTQIALLTEVENPTWP